MLVGLLGQLGRLDGTSSIAGIGSRFAGADAQRSGLSVKRVIGEWRSGCGDTYVLQMVERSAEWVGLLERWGFWDVWMKLLLPQG